MKYFINDIEQESSTACSLAQALEIYFKNYANTELSKDSYVVAVNQNFVPRSEYQQCLITAGDKVEVLSPMAGG